MTVVDAVVGLTTASDEESPPAADPALRAARVAVQHLRVRREQIDSERQAILRLAQAKRPAPAAGQAPTPSPTAARLALLAFRAAEHERLLREREALDRELTPATGAMLAAEAHHAASSSMRRARQHEARTSVVATLRWNSDGAAAVGSLVIEYLVPGARWVPTYVIRLDGGRARIELRAQVSQRSGEDWRDVRLTLSTAEAQRWHPLPELSAIRIGRRQSAPTKAGWREPPTGAEGLYADFDRAHTAAREDEGWTGSPSPRVGRITEM